MAHTWRLRHKLAFGLALLALSVALVFASALFGLRSYLDTGRLTQSKLRELTVVQELADLAHNLTRTPPALPGVEAVTPLNAERLHVKATLALLEAKLADYRAAVKSAPAAPHDYAELARIAESAKAVGAAADKPSGAGRLIDQPAAATAYSDLKAHISTQNRLLVDDIAESHRQSEANHTKAMLLAGSAAAVALVLVLTMLHCFRQWVLAPIREIQLGVRRLHQGEFDQPIHLSAPDEFGELAGEFNGMAARLRDVYTRLEDQVNDRTRQLVRSERLVSVGFLAAGVSHEINNPLASIAFCADALERRLPDLAGPNRRPQDVEVAEKYLKMIQDESQRCKTITQKLLDFSRSGGKREPADLSKILSDVIDVAKVLPNARNKRITAPPTGSVVAPVSVTDLKGVVLNLVVNALDSMDDGGELTVELASRNGAAELSFRDTGCGMTPDTLEHIFEPFFTRSRTGNGTGLGLSISHQVIDQHGGSISAASPGVGRGSTFTVRLPLEDPAPNSVADRPQAPRLRQTVAA